MNPSASGTEPTGAPPSMRQCGAGLSLVLTITHERHGDAEFEVGGGDTAYACMLRGRLERARRLVIRSRVPIADIGMLADFPYAAHSTDRFRREMGVPPGALRWAAHARTDHEPALES